MKRRLAAIILALFLALRLSTFFSIFWANQISRPLLGAMARIGESVSFALLEWILVALGIALLLSMALRRFMRMLSCMLLSAFALFVMLWYPLYFLPHSDFSADDAQLSLLCTSIIDELNAGLLRFETPENLPAKTVRYPQWMDALSLNGFCSFFTGEALISPDIAPSALPFVAVHEHMHLEGHACEGSANIAAWHNCMERGGAYADSARLWALRYAMGMLRRISPPFYDENLLRMNSNTLRHYQEAGGAYSSAPLPALLSRIYGMLGIEASMRDYEILAPYLAAQLQE